MTSLREWIVRLWGTLWPGRRDADLEEELRVHLEMAAPHEAANEPDGRRAAVARHGAIAPSMEALRDQRGLPRLADLARDTRFALRAMRRTPTFTAVAVLTLALGIGANTAIFGLADAVVFRPLPVDRPQDLVVLRPHGPRGDTFPFTSSAAADLASNREALAGLAAFRPLPGTIVSVTINGESDVALAQLVSGNYHALLGVHALVGRTLSEQDREPVAVISYRYWQRRFAGDPNMIGRTLEMQRRSFTIVGVTPPGFFGTQPGRHVDITAPLAARTQAMAPNARWLYLIGRLRPDVSRQQAAAALRVRWAQLAAGEPAPAIARSTLELDSGAQGLNELGRQFSMPLRILMTAMAVVLLITCANLAGLLIARSHARQHEIAVRLSLGAGRARIVRQLMTESVLLAAAGGLAGTALGRVLTDLILAMMSRGRTAIVLEVALDARTLTFAAAVTLLTALLFGLLPAIAACRADLPPALKRRAPGTDTTRHSWGRAMVAAQVALLVLLLVFAGLFARTLHKLRSVDAGFRPEHVLVVAVPTGPGSRGTAARTLYDDLFARFSALPGVASVSLSMDTPLGGELSMGAGISIPGRPDDAEDAPQVYHNIVGPRFFETMGIPVLSGRDFSISDDERAPRCAIISDSVARRYFRGENPLGREISFRGVVASVIGVVKDVRYTSLRTDAPLMIYRPARQEVSAPASAFLIRTASGTPEALLPLLRAEARAAAPALPPPSAVMLTDQVAGSLVEERMLATLSGAIGVLAAILAAIGIYGVIAATVARRRREIGIRMAIGARPGQMARTVVVDAFTIAAAGLVAGVPVTIVAALAARRLLAGVLFELSPGDPPVLLAAAGAILLIASLAAWLPARRASRIDPVAALKYE